MMPSLDCRIGLLLRARRRERTEGSAADLWVPA
jgi:hypothetical protein